LVLAPHGRDAEVASNLLREIGRPARVYVHIPQLCVELGKGGAFAPVAEEALATGDLDELVGWIGAQPAWSDFPIVLITRRGDAPERNTIAQQWQNIPGNVSFLERPFHPTTLVSVAGSALRSRRRQYQARDLLERYALLAGELQHRTKNLLSIILSIGSASLREGGEGRDAFFARLHALAKAQDLLIGGDGRGASMKDVVEQALDSFGTRVSIEGPPVFLKPSAAQGFALIMHELATNASKHGALTAATGTVSVRWSLEANSTEATEATILFQWQERGGPPAERAQRKGFGSVLLEHAVANADADCPPHFDYSAEGFTYELRAALAISASPHTTDFSKWGGAVAPTPI
jgi:two-component sensor histidine kinase